MKTINSKIIHAFYWCFLVGFFLHIYSVGATLYAMFAKGISVASEIRISQDFNERVKDFSNIRIVEGTNAHAIFNYDNLSQMNNHLWLVLSINILYQILWLCFTWLLLSVFKSLKNNSIFEQQNILRLRLAALIIGLSPILQIIKNKVFASTLREEITLENKYINFYYDYSLFSGIFYMFIILMLVEIFRYGMNLKTENDLTI